MLKQLNLLIVVGYYELLRALVLLKLLNLLLKLLIVEAVVVESVLNQLLNLLITMLKLLIVVDVESVVVEAVDCW